MTPPATPNTLGRHRTGLAIVLVGMLLFATGLGAVVLSAGDSYSRIVRQLRTEYHATPQFFYGAGPLSALAVAMIRPAGVSSLKFTVLKDLTAATGPAGDFNQIVRSALDPEWRSLVVQASQSRGEWTHVYSQPDGRHLKLLIVNRTGAEAFVVEVRIDPDKLSAFIDNPQILGIRVGDSYDGSRVHFGDRWRTLR